MIDRLDPNRCAEKVHDNGRGVGFHQCARKPIAGTLFCKQHDPAIVRARIAAMEKRWAAEIAERNAKWEREAAMDNLCKDVETSVLESLGAGWLAKHLEAK